MAYCAHISGDSSNGRRTRPHACALDRLLFTACAVVTVSALTWCGTLCAQDLTDDEIITLAALNQADVTQVIKLAAQVDQWRTQLVQIKATAKNAKQALATGQNIVNHKNNPAAVDLAYLIAGALKDAASESKVIAGLINYDQTLKPILDKAEQHWQSAKFDAEIYFDIDEQEFRDELKELARAGAAQQVLDIFDKQLADKLKKYRTPAKFAQDFLENQVRKTFLAPNVYSFGDREDKVTLSIQQQDFSKSLFSHDANLTVILQYQKDLTVKATGLYFVYKKGQKVPGLGLDKLRVDAADLATTIAGKTLSVLGDAIDLGLPIKIDNPVFHTHDNLGGNPPNSLSIDIKIGGFLEAVDVSFSTSATIQMNGNVTLGSLTCPVPGVQVPIPGTLFIMDGYEITLKPKDRNNTITLETWITTLDGTDTITLSVHTTFGLPLDPKKGIKFEGDLLVEGKHGEQLGTCTVAINSEGITGHLKIPDKTTVPLGNVLQLEADFVLDKGGLSADGAATIFTVIKAACSLALRPDGSGFVRAHDGFSIGKVDADANVLFQVAKGCQKFTLTAVLSVDVDLKFMRGDAIVTIDAAVPGDIVVSAEVSGIKAGPVTIRPTLAVLDPDYIALMFAADLAEVLQQFAKAAAKWAENEEVLLAHWDKHWREEIVKIAATIPTDVGKEISEGAKDGGKWASDTWKKAGGQAAELLKDPAKVLQSVPGNAAREFRNALHSVAGNNGEVKKWQGRSSDDSSPGPTPEELAAADLLTKLEAKLAPLSAAINKAVVHKATTDKSPAVTKVSATDRFYQSRSELGMRFLYAAGGGGNVSGSGAIGFTISSSALRSDVKPDGQKGKSKNIHDRQSKSSVTAGHIKFTSLVTNSTDGKNLPKAQIVMPEIPDPSGFNATVLARHEIQKLLEQYLPDVEIDGLHTLYEKKVAVSNASGEPVTLWVQVYSRDMISNRLSWHWDPNNDHSAKHALKFVIPAKTVKPMLLYYEDAVSDKPVVKVGKILKNVAKEDRKPVKAAQLVVWAESESGERWTEHQFSPIELVEPNNFDGQRSYDDTSMQTYVYRIDPKSGQQRFDERVVSFRNDTFETLKVSGRYRSSKDGVLSWRDLPPVSVDSKQTVVPRGDDGMRLRASCLTFSALGEDLRFTTYKQEPLWVVPESPGGRAYLAPKIGQLEYVFTIQDEKQVNTPAAGVPMPPIGDNKKAVK